MAQTVSEFLSRYFTPEVVVFIISMMPILELRGGLIIASAANLPLTTALPLTIIGTMLPVPIILLFVKPVLFFLQKHGPIKKIATKFIDKAMTKGPELVAKYPRKLQLGLFLFVAIPLPGTGAWTGSLIAAFLGIDLRKSLVPICCGVLGAAVIMTTLAYFLPALFGFK